MKARWLLLLALLRPLAAEELTLDQAVRLALASNPGVHRRTEEALAEKAAVARVGAEEWPRLFLETAYKDGFPGAPNFSFRGFVQSSSIVNWGSDAVFSWTYDFGRSAARTRSQQHLADSARAEEKLQMCTVALRVVKSYNDVLLSRAILALEDKNLESRATIARYAQTRFRAGTIGRVDVGLAEAGLAEARVRQIKARNDVDQSLAVLANAMGQDSLSGSVVETEDTGAGLLQGTLDQDLGVALQRRPDLESARSRVAAGEESLAAADAGHRPTLRFLAATGYLETRTPQVPDNYAFGLALTFPIYSGGGVEAEIDEAQHRLNALNDRVTDQAQAARLEVTRARLLLSSLLESRQASEERVRQASDSERLATLRYKHGMGTIVELQQAQLALLSAQTDQARLRYDTLTACYALRFVRGEILDSFGGAP